MNLLWQDTAALALVGLAVAYLARRWWLTWSGQKRAACGGCSGCGSSKPTTPTVVELTLTPPTRSKG
ncbi:MAG: hypothetical protein WDZ59_06780 [Pirellulales bacterium]